MSEIFDFRVIGYQSLSDDIMQVMLAPDDVEKKIFHYQAGQYIKFLLPHDEARSFSIANAPNDENNLEFHIRHQKNNLYAKHLVDYLKQKNMIQINGPFGKLRYHTHPRIPLIFIATGTGFAPCKAIIEQALQDKDCPAIELYWGARQQSDLYFHDKLIAFSKTYQNFHYLPVVKERVYNAVLHHHTNDLSEFHIYASGHEDMVITAQKLLQYPPYFYSDWLE